MANQRNKNSKSRLQGAETAHLTQRLARNDNASIGEMQKVVEKINEINASKAAMSLDKRAGFIFEEVHAGTFNAAARKAGDFNTTAMTGSSGGFAVDQRVDIRVVRGANTLVEAQAKCCGTVERSAVAVSKPQYAGTQRLLPSDQASKAQEMLSQSAKTKATSPNPRMRQIGASRQEAASKVTDRLKAAGHESKPISHAEANTLASGDTSKITRTIMTETVGSAAKNAAKSGMAISGAISAVTGLSKVATGKMSGKEAAKTIVTDALAGGARSAATAVAAEGVKVMAKRSLTSGAAAAFSAGSGPLAVAGCAVELVTDACKGELTTKKAARSATRAAGGWAGAEGGALLGSAICPGVGTIVGAVLGGIGGSLLGGLW